MKFFNISINDINRLSSYKLSSVTRALDMIPLIYIAAHKKIESTIGNQRTLNNKSGSPTHVVKVIQLWMFICCINKVCWHKKRAPSRIKNVWSTSIEICSSLQLLVVFVHNSSIQNSLFINEFSWVSDYLLCDSCVCYCNALLGNSI